jgi:hypothetical protein
MVKGKRGHVLFPLLQNLELLFPHKFRHLSSLSLGASLLLGHSRHTNIFARINTYFLEALKVQDRWFGSFP